MTTTQKTKITVKTNINVPIERIWKLWNDPFHIMHWYHASEDWQTTWAENNLKVGGKFLYRMEAKDGSTGFDFTGKYNTVVYHKLINYTIADGRSVIVSFISNKEETTVTEIFEAEDTNTYSLQKQGWQSILNNFKKYAESSGIFEKLHFEIPIQAGINIVFQTLIDEKYFPEWTKEFNSSSRFEGSWNKNSKILFVGDNDDGTVGGMVSRIKENIPEKFISIEHQGIIENGKEITTGVKANGWSGGLENYTLRSVNKHTLLIIDSDINLEFKELMQKSWPKALNKLKEICESQKSS